MTELTKQRVLGVIVVLLVLIALLPTLLRQPAKMPEQSTPILQKMPVGELDLQVAPQNSLSLKSEIKKIKPAPVVAEKVKHSVVVVNRVAQKDLFKTPQAWVVLLASFKDAQRAKKLLQRLRAQGFDAYLRQVMLKKQEQHITRVYVGPNINRNEIQKTRKLLQQQFKLNGLVRQYKV
jgi:DedD protein